MSKNNPLRGKKCLPTPEQRASVYATSCPGGEPQLNGVTAPRLAGKVLYIEDEAIVPAPFTKTIIATEGVLLPNGSQSDPPLAFIDEFATGLFKKAPGEVAITVGNIIGLCVSQTTVTVAPTITTFGGTNLSINPGGPDIDFNGKNLVNVGAVVSDPNKIPFSSGTPVTTLTDTPTTVATIATTADNAYSIDAVISCISTLDNDSTASIKLFGKGKNIAGTVSVSSGANHVIRIADPPLQGAGVPLVSATIGVSGTNLVVQVIGINGVSLRWYATGDATLVGL